MRIGQGFDAHRFSAGRRLILGGVDVPFHLGLAAHSDGDVAIHALCDALLGAAALGDIGRHFPDTDAKWAGVDSRLLLRQVAERVHARHFRIINVDVTLIAQRPKLAPYIAAMQINLAADLGLTLDCVNVKATTTEGMGFTGREEGIAASAVALVERHPGS
jgi:2-C-methyl-D-erythritol 2,4-cyclodiphosphate synthase